MIDAARTWRMVAYIVIAFATLLLLGILLLYLMLESGTK